MDKVTKTTGDDGSKITTVLVPLGSEEIIAKNWRLSVKELEEGETNPLSPMEQGSEYEVSLRLKSRQEKLS